MSKFNKDEAKKSLFEGITLVMDSARNFHWLTYDEIGHYPSFSIINDEKRIFWESKKGK